MSKTHSALARGDEAVSKNAVIRMLENFLFGNRKLVIAFFVLLTVFMAWSATSLKIDAGFTKLLPLKHEYMQTFIKHQQDFGGANRILIALTVPEGDIFTPEFFEVLKKATDDVFFIPGVNRSRVSSLFTPNVRFTEVVEDGIAGGNVVPADFSPTPEGLEQVRKNILKSGIVGRLVANDFSGAIISAQLLEIDPNTGKKLDFIGVAKQLEEQIRQRYKSAEVNVELNQKLSGTELTIDTSYKGVDVHIIGFAKQIGDITEGAGRVLLFFLIAFVITALMVWYYSMSVKLTIALLACSLTAVIWQLGLLPLLGFGIDPMSILVPFLVFAIGVSHGVQMVGAVRAEIFLGASSTLLASRRSFRRLLIPGSIALASDTIGFITILLISIQIIQEMAITAALGVMVIILTNLLLLPVLISYIHLGENFFHKLQVRALRMAPVWAKMSNMVLPRWAITALIVGVALAVFGAWKGKDVAIGDLHRGVPELREDSRYNIDSQIITERFSVGVDILSVIVETKSEGCIDYDVMRLIDRFAWHMENQPGVQSVITLPQIAKRINAGWNEGSPKWQVLPRDPRSLAQATSPVDTSSGLLNKDCSVMPVLVFTKDHKAETIEQIIAEIKSFRDENGTDDTRFMLATSNVGVMAATNEAVAAAQYPMLIYVFSAIIVLCLLTYRSLMATICIVAPLALVSLLAYALMSALEIGLKVNTLPVVALGVGIGVDYGIYIFSRLRGYLDEGHSLHESYRLTLAAAGGGVMFTGIGLAVGVATWIFSPLKFQADMGIMLTFMFLVNMLGAMFLLPALARFLLRIKPAQKDV